MVSLLKSVHCTGWNSIKSALGLHSTSTKGVVLERAWRCSCSTALLQSCATLGLLLVASRSRGRCSWWQALSSWCFQLPWPRGASAPAALMYWVSSGHQEPSWVLFLWSKPLLWIQSNCRMWAFGQTHFHPHPAHVVSSHPVAAVPMAEGVAKEGLCQLILAKPVFSSFFFFFFKCLWSSKHLTLEVWTLLQET